jgi:hypothetical protein
VSTDPGNPGYPGKTLEFKSILEFLEKPWNCVENPGKITLQSIFVDICRYLSIFVDTLTIWVDRMFRSLSERKSLSRSKSSEIVRTILYHIIIDILCPKKSWKTV